MLECCRGGSALGFCLSGSHPRLVFGAKLSHNSFTLQVDEILSRRDRGQPSHPLLGVPQAFDRGYPKCVPVCQSLEDVESVIHRSLLVVAVGPSESRSRTSSSVCEAEQLPQQGQPVGRCRVVEVVFSGKNRSGTFFGSVSKIFHHSYRTCGYSSIGRRLAIARPLYERSRMWKLSSTISDLSLRISASQRRRVSSLSL